MLKIGLLFKKFIISQDHMEAMISEGVADDVQRNFYKIYFFEYSFCETLQTLLALWIFLDKITDFKSFSLFKLNYLLFSNLRLVQLKVKR